VGVPVRAGGFAFWPVALLAGLLFGASHVPWSSALGVEHVPTLLLTGAGGVWFAWLYRAWRWNLWATIALHAAMNLAWMLFDVADDAVGALWPNVGRAATIALATVIALRRARASGGS
jgi:membrane protease YdiL (CAAX protease family)